MPTFQEAGSFLEGGRRKDDMPVQHRLQRADEISHQAVISSWDQAAEEFVNFSAEWCCPLGHLRREP